MKNNLRKIFRKAHFLKVLVFMLLIGSIPTLNYAQPAGAVAGCDYDYYSSNNILFYGCGSCSVSGGNLASPAPTSLTGATNQEKTWNYFSARGLTPVAAAGAMGNIAHESNFSASIEEASGGDGLGIIQWTGDRRTKLEAAASAAGIDLKDNDSALLFELNYLWDGEYGAMTWQEQMNAEKSVEGDTTIASYNSNFSAQRAASQAGNGSTMLFHALIEQSNDVPTEADRVPGVGVLAGRIDKAKEFLELYQDTGSTAGDCSIGAGGLTFDQAVEVAKKLVDNWETNFCAGDILTSGTADGYCSWTTGYCTAASAWLAKRTAPDPARVRGIPHGVRVADQLISSVPDVYTAANPDGSNLQPFSIWSLGEGTSDGSPGHTGTILGVGTDGSLITLELNWYGGDPNAKQTFNHRGSGRSVTVYEFPSFEAFKEIHSSRYDYNNTATPLDSSIAAEMGKKMLEFLNN